MNHGTVSGTLGKDPEIFAPQNSEYSCLKFSIANNDKSYKDDKGNWQNKTSWLDVEFWTKKPQYWLQKLYKGTSINTEFELEQQSWEKDGSKRSKIVLKIPNGKFPYIIEGNKQPAEAVTGTVEDDDRPPF